MWASPRWMERRERDVVSPRWREPSKSRKAGDLRAVGRRVKKKRRDLAMRSFSLHGEEENWGSGGHLATSASSHI